MNNKNDKNDKDDNNNDQREEIEIEEDTEDTEKENKSNNRVINQSEKSMIEEDSNKFVSFLFDTAELFALSLALVVVIMTFFVRHSPVIGSSMIPTITGSEPAISTKGDVLLISNLFYTPTKNDIVIIQSTHNMVEPIVKRVIATEGDKLEIDFSKWIVKVNGVELDESYVNPVYKESGMAMASFSLDPDGDGKYAGTVPDGCIFVMGDNRNNSHDSRASDIGFIDTRYVLGKAILRIWPFSSFGSLNK